MKNKSTSEFEFIAMMASLMALASLSIDALLPGLEDIGRSINVINPKDNQLLIVSIFVGMGLGQLVTGTLSDGLGRKPIVYIGYVVFAVASIICILSNSLEMMIFGRVLQGVGLSGPRSVSTSIIRDRFSGDYMARIMSFISAVFIIVPVIAPVLGGVMIDYWGWESVFYSQILFGLVVVLWFGIRQTETLKVEHKKEVNLSMFRQGAKLFFEHKKAVLYTVVLGIMSAPFLAYISASQYVFEVQYDLEDLFPYIFSGLALVIGLSTYLNGLLVVRLGMFKMSMVSMSFIVLASLSYVAFFGINTNPSSIYFVFFLAVILFLMGFVMGNVSALAMQPVGYIAGVSAAIIGFLSTIITGILATVIGRFVEEVAVSFFIGFAVVGAISLSIMWFNQPKGSC